MSRFQVVIRYEKNVEMSKCAVISLGEKKKKKRSYLSYFKISQFLRVQKNEEALQRQDKFGHENITM